MHPADFLHEELNGAQPAHEERRTETYNEKKWAGKARRRELLQVGKGHSISEISALAEDS
jgi:hypothetical protein